MNIQNLKNNEKIISNQNSQQNIYKNTKNNSNLHRNYLTLDSYNLHSSNNNNINTNNKYNNINNKTSINSISCLPYQDLKTPLRNEFRKETRNNIDDTFKINSYTPNRNYNSNNINDINLYNNSSVNDTKIKTQIISLQNRLNLYEESLEKTKNQYEEQINNYMNQIKLYNNLFVTINNFFIFISNNYIPEISPFFKEGESQEYISSYFLNDKNINIKFKKIEDYIIRLNKDLNDYKFKYQKLLDLDSCRPPLSNKNSLTNNNKENEYRKQNSSSSDMCDITGNSIYNFNNHPENIFENNFENYQKNSVPNNNNKNIIKGQIELLNGNNYEEKNPFKNISQNDNDIYKTLEQRVLILERELLSKKNTNNNFYDKNSVNIDRDKSVLNDNENSKMNQNEYFNYKSNDLYMNNIDIKKVRAKSGPRISSNNRFNNKKNNDDVSILSDDKVKKKKMKKKKKKDSFIYKNGNMNDISNCKFEDGRKSHQSYTSNINNRSEKKLKKNKQQKNKGNVLSNINKINSVKK